MAFNLKMLRDPVYRILGPATDWLVARGVHPNAITTLGFVTTIAAGLFYRDDHVRIAGFLVLMGGVFDIFDGRVARISGKASVFGSFYDSTLDRISEIVVYLGLLSLYNDYGSALADIWMIYIIMLAMGGSLMVSYTRAKAEALGLDCKVGLMQRAERIVLLGLGSLLFGLMWDGFVLSWVIVIVAILTNFTALQRIFWVYRRGTGLPLEGVGSSGDEVPEAPRSRGPEPPPGEAREAPSHGIRSAADPGGAAGFREDHSRIDHTSEDRR